MARNYPNWLKAYCQFTEASEAPLDFHFWTGVSTIAAVLQRRVWKDELHFKWTPNFYIIFVGPAGVVTKSTTLNVGYKLLQNVKNAKGNPVVHFGPDSMTWHGLAKHFDDAISYHSYQENGVDKKVLMSPLTCSISELGTFLRPDDTGLISFLTDVWDGKDRPFLHTTATAGKIQIENAWLNVIGATTPAWLQNNFPASLISEGIGSRIIFIYAENKRRLTAYPSRAPRAADYANIEAKLVADLEEIAKIIGPYDLTDEAYTWGEKWYQDHNTLRKPIFASGRYSGYLARKQTHLHKLAMILAAAKRDDRIIQEEDLKEADAILASVEVSMIRVFESMGVVDEAKHIAEIVNFVTAHKWITGRDLYRLCFNIMSERDFKQAVKIAVDGDLLEVTKVNNIAGLSPKARTIN